MKRLLPLLALILLLAGCDLRNRRPSSDFVPSSPPGGQQSVSTAHHTEANPTAPGPAPVSSGEAVRTVLSESGVFDRDFSYSYQVPFLDLPDGYAMGCNREISERFDAPANEALEAMQNGMTPELSSVSFTWDVRGSVLTLRVRKTSVDPPAEEQGVYCVNAATGAKPTLAEFCEAAGVPAESFSAALQEAARARLRELAGAKYKETDSEYTTALTLTLSRLADPAALPMTLTEDGRLSVIVTVSTPAGGSSTEALILP